MDTSLLRSYRRNAVHIRHALAQPAAEAGRVQLEDGYLHAAGRVLQYKRLSIPVRRALNANDSASFARALDALTDAVAGNPASASPAVPPGVSPAIPSALPDVAAVRRAWDALQAELDSVVGFGGARVPRREILAAWLTAAAFYDEREREHSYDALIERWGPAAEAMGTQLASECARVLLLLDDAAAAVLGEPVILPPPPKTPPPPRDPEERWWNRLLGGRRR